MTTLDLEKQRLLLKLLRERGTAAETPRIARVPPGTAVPLNPSQARIWFSCRRYPESTEYSMPDLRVVERALDFATLRDATAQVMARHDILRVRMFERDGIPVQQDRGPVEPPVTWHDLRHLPADEAAAEATAISNRAVQRPFPLDGSCLFTIIGFALPGDRTMLATNFHHLVVDGLSRAQVVQELDALLEGRPLDPPPPVGFLDYVAWEREHVDEAAIQRDLAYWTDKLAGELPVLDLPRDHPRPAASSRGGHTVPVTIPGPLLARLQRLAADEGVTLFVVVMAAYKLFLARMAGQRDVLVGAPLAGRDEVAESIVGCFVRSLPLRTDLSGDPTFRDVVRRVHDTLLEAHDHQTVPYDRVVAELGLRRLAGVHPVFQTMMNLQQPGAGADGMAGFRVELDTNSAMWDLALSLATDGDGLSGIIVYSADLFQRATAQRFADTLVRLLDAVAERPDARAFALPLQAPDEQHRLLHRDRHGRPDAPYRPDGGYRTLARLFEERVRHAPDAVAVRGDHGHLTYAELNGRANRLARALRDSGAGPGGVVALCLSGVDEIVAVVAAVKGGTPYVSLDPDDDRFAAMLADAAPAVVVTDAATAGRVPAGSWRTLSLARPEGWAGASAADLPADGAGPDLLCLRYLAGAADPPVAVAYPVEGALAELERLRRAHPLGPSDVVLLDTPERCFWPLAQGATIAVCPPAVQRDLQRLPEFVDAHGVTTLSVVPSMAPDVAGFPGEVVTGHGLPETGRVTENGQPAAHHTLRVLDEALSPVPVGVAGELYAGGIGLARGYHRRPGLTAARFVADPYGAPGSRMFRTGELCRYREDGVLEHLGPIDRQIRSHGLRVEPAEIEAAFTEQDGVWRAVVTAAPDGGLAAFVVPDEDRQLSGRALLDGAARRLPDYLMPATVTVVERIPRTGRGEIDMAALLELRDRDADAARPDGADAPRTPLEAALAGIFSRVLRRDSVPVTESFFTMGGHSLLVFKLIEECASDLGLRPTVQDVFTGPTVRALAATLGAIRAASAADPLVRLAENPGAPLVVLVHAASGSVLPFYEVAKRLGREFAVYGLQSSPDDPPASIEQIAARYVAAVDAVRGVAPVVVAGWSMGGGVALEMARRWLERGEPVAATLLLDTWAPPAFMSSAEDAAQVRRSVLELGVLRLEGVGDAAAALAELPAMVERNRAAFLDYRPEYYPGEVDLLRASDPLPPGAPPFPAGYMAGDRGWSAVVAEVTTVEIKGNHLSIFDQEHADELAAAISAAIARRMGFEEI